MSKRAFLQGVTFAAAWALAVSGSSGGVQLSQARPADVSPDPPLTYKLVDLGPAAPFDTSEARGINDDGVVVGESAPDSSCSDPHCDDASAVEWHVDSHGNAAATMLPSLGLAGGGDTIAYGINENGEVAGQSQNLPVAWQNGALTNLASGFPNRVVGFASGINKAGEIVGGTEPAPQVAGTVMRATAWAPTTLAPTVLQDGLPGSQFFDSDANAIADDGSIVGIAGDIFGTRAFWTPADDQPLTDLLGMGPVNNGKFAESINNHGEIVGYVNGHGPGGFSSGGFRATVFRNGSASPPADLGTLDNPDAGHSSWANAVNDSGQIVGVSYVGNDGYEHAALWDSNGTIHDLNDLVPADSGLFLSEATAINSSGEIVGWGYPEPKDDSSSNGVYHAFLLIPQARLELKGLELTQALQDLRNTIALTAGKRTYVRAYLDWTGSGTRETGGLLYGTRDGTPLPGSPLQPVDGTIEARTGSIDRRGTWNDSLNFLLPTSWTQGTVDLEFKLPDDDKTTLSCEEATGIPDDCQASVQFQPVGQLQVKLFPTQWSRNFGITGQLPIDTYTFQTTFDDILGQVNVLRAATPTASVDWTTGSVLTNQPADALANDNFLRDYLGDLDRTLEYIRDLDGCLQGCNRIYAALVRFEVNGIFLGAEGLASAIPGTAASIAMDTRPEQPGRAMLAHEIGHDLGLIHDVSSALPPYHNDGQTDPALDAYGDPMRQGPCTEVAGANSTSDTRTTDYPFFAAFPGTQSFLKDGDPPVTPGIRPVFGPPGAEPADQLYAIDSSLIDSEPADAVFDPTHAFDLMSYCPAEPPGPPNGWAAGQPTYDAMRAGLDARFPVAPTPRVVRRSSRAQTGPITYVVARGSVDVTTDAVSFEPFGSLTTSQPVPRSDGPYTAKLVDSSGATVAQVPFMPELGHGDPAPGSPTPPLSTEGNFIVLLPTDGSANRVEILDNGSVIGSVTASPHRPTATITSPSSGDTLTGSSTDVHWAASDADGDALSAVVQYSADGGETWSTLTADVDTDHYAIDTSQLASSDDARIRVVVSDGFNTTAATAGRLHVANHAPLLSVSTPGDGAEYTSDQAIALSADAYDAEEGPLSGGALRWTIDGAAVGNGSNVVVEASSLASGDHTVIATATDSSGATTMATRHISIGSARSVGTFQAGAVGGQSQTTTTGTTTAPPLSSPSAAPAAPAAPGQPALSVAATAVPAAPSAGTAFAVKTIVANGHAGAATGVVVSETIPTGVTLASVSATQGKCTTTVALITCVFGTVQPGADATLDIAAVAAQPGTDTWTATVVDGNGGRHTVTLTVGIIRNSPPALTASGSAFAPPLQTRRVGHAAVLTATVHVDEPVTLSMRVIGPRSVSLLRGSSVGTRVVRSPARSVSGAVAAGSVRVHLRLRAVSLNAKARYRISLVAVDAQGLRSTLTMPFTAGRR